MRYQPCLELWGQEEALLNGTLVLQSGQWVTCGGEPKSRYIGTNGRSIDCCHGGNGKQVARRYRERVTTNKGYCSIGWTIK